MNYYLGRDGKNLGIFPLDDLHRQRQSGELTGAEFVWAEGMPDWQPLDTVLRAKGLSVPTPVPASVAARKTNRVLVTVAITGAVLFLGVIVLVGFLARDAIKTVRRAAKPIVSGQADGLNATAPVKWGTNTLTEADVKKSARAFRVRQYVEAYAKHGRRGHPCDAEGKQLLESWLAHNYGGDATNLPSPHELADKLAARSACDDALVLTIAGVNSTEVHEKIRRLERALAAYGKSQYKAYPRWYATVTLSAEMNDKSERRRALDASGVQLLKQAFTDGSLGPGDQAEMAEILLEGWGAGFFARNREVARKIADDVSGFEWLGHVLDGEYHVQEGWKVRGGGYANTVTQEGWKGFAEQFGKADRAFTKAWELRPDLPLPAVRMITVAMGNSGEEEMRKWFDRAIAAQIDHPKAWSSMLWGLRPRWHGSHEAMLALGIAAIDTGRFDTDVPRKFFDAVSGVESELQLRRGERIFGRSDIWPHIQRLYEGYIAEPTEAYRRDGWRSTYATVAYFAKKYDVAGEQLNAVNWKPWPDNITAWGIDMSLMPLEVAARTSPLARDIARAEARYRGGANYVNEALELYSELKNSSKADERTKRFIEHRLAALEVEDRLLHDEWVNLMPRDEKDPNWIISGGKVRWLNDGIEVETDDGGHLLYSRVRVGRNFEVKGEFEVVRSSTTDFQAGIVMGLPDNYNSEWYGLRLKRNQTEGEVVSFGRCWGSQEVKKSVGLNDQRNSFQFRYEEGKADTWVNGKQVLFKAAPMKTMRVYNDSMLGLGAYHDVNTTVIRYRNVQVRRIATRDAKATDAGETQ